MTYKGVVKENTVILPEDVHLPDGTVVEVTVSSTVLAAENEVSPEELKEEMSTWELSFLQRKTSWRIVPELVLDASVAIKWVNPSEPLADTAILMRDDYGQGHVSVVVPTFWDYEVTNGVNKAIARGQLSAEEGDEAIALLLAGRAQKVPLPSPQDSYALARRS